MDIPLHLKKPRRIVMNCGLWLKHMMCFVQTQVRLGGILHKLMHIQLQIMIVSCRVPSIFPLPIMMLILETSGSNWPLQAVSTVDSLSLYSFTAILWPFHCSTQRQRSVPGFRPVRSHLETNLSHLRHLGQGWLPSCKITSVSCTWWCPK